MIFVAKNCAMEYDTIVYTVFVCDISLNILFLGSIRNC